MDKGDILEFFMVYGWAVLAVIVAVCALTYFYYNSNNTTQIVCNQHGLVKNNIYYEYPPLENLAKEIENRTNGTINMMGLNGKVISYTSENDKPSRILCSFPSQLCYNIEDNDYCEDINLYLYIDYSEWLAWKNTEKEK